jgi:hypothetical protein
MEHRHTNPAQIPNAARDLSLLHVAQRKEPGSQLDVEVGVEARGQFRGIFGLRVEAPRNGKQAEAQIRLIDKFYGNDGDALIHPWDVSRSHIVRRERLDELEARVRRFAESVQKRPQGGNRLVIGDVYRLRSMMEEFFEEQLTRSSLVIR